MIAPMVLRLESFAILGDGRDVLAKPQIPRDRYAGFHRPLWRGKTTGHTPPPPPPAPPPATPPPPPSHPPDPGGVAVEKPVSTGTLYATHVGFAMKLLAHLLSICVKGAPFVFATKNTAIPAFDSGDPITKRYVLLSTASGTLPDIEFPGIPHWSVAFYQWAVFVTGSATKHANMAAATSNSRTALTGDPAGFSRCRA